MFHYHEFKSNGCLYVESHSFSHKQGKYFHSHTHTHTHTHIICVKKLSIFKSCLCWKFSCAENLFIFRNYACSKYSFIRKLVAFKNCSHLKLTWHLNKIDSHVIIFIDIFFLHI
jgi:hypothetical protein